MTIPPSYAAAITRVGDLGSTSAKVLTCSFQEQVGMNDQDPTATELDQAPFRNSRSDLTTTSRTLPTAHASSACPIVATNDDPCCEAAARSRR